MEPGSDEDKEARGRALIIGGEAALPGAIILAGIAALRAGAGKLQLATCRSIAPHVGAAVPESLSISLDETAAGTIHPSAAGALADIARKADAVLIGPGTRGSDDNTSFVRHLLKEMGTTPVILDAGALDALNKFPDSLHPFDGNAILTPHAGEMSRVIGISESEVTDNAPVIAVEAAQSLGAVVALKGARTFIASPGGNLLCYESGDVGLATSGSGDTLAGIAAGLLARGAEPLQCAAWAVFLHGAAGNALAKRMGRIGYLARELLDEIPPIMNGFS
jgi:ADP-dependent NAD(P)H-hydrate dehydratase